MGALIFELFAAGALLLETAGPGSPPESLTDGPWRLARITEPGLSPKRGLEVWLSEADLAAAQASGDRFRRIVTLVHQSDARAEGRQDASLALTEFDCENGRWRELTSWEIVGGEPRAPETQSAEWLHYIPHTPPVFVSDLVCEATSYEKLKRAASSRDAFAYERELDRLFDIAQDAHLDGYSAWVRMGAIPHEGRNNGEAPVWFREKVAGDEARNPGIVALAWPVTTWPKDRSAAYHRVQIRCASAGPAPSQYSSHDNVGGLVSEIELEEAHRMLSDSSLGAIASMACAGDVPADAERSTGLDRFWPSPSDLLRPIRDKIFREVGITDLLDARGLDDEAKTMLFVAALENDAAQFAELYPWLPESLQADLLGRAHAVRNQPISGPTK